MTHIPFDNNYHTQEKAAHIILDNDYYYRIPLLPKIGIIINFSSAILSGILTVVFTIMDQHKFIQTILQFSNLMLCFAFGAVVAVIACIFDYRARHIYRSSASKKPIKADVADIYDVCALIIFVASLAIFTFGVYLTVYLVRIALL
jgi:hypothetical protein